MSKKSNVNPDHYKTRGREPIGQDVVHELERQKLTQERSELEKESAKPLPIPGTVGKKKPDRSPDNDRTK